MEQERNHGGPRFLCPGPTLPDDDDELVEDSDVGSDVNSDEMLES